jgi:hypothetical protein
MKHLGTCDKRAKSTFSFDNPDPPTRFQAILRVQVHNLVRAAESTRFQQFINDFGATKCKSCSSEETILLICRFWRP